MTSAVSEHTRLWAKIDKRDRHSCWEWTAGPTGRYGTLEVKRDGKWVARRAHRLVLEEYLGRPLGAGMQALHRCNNTRCCNPHHLYEGDHGQNMVDKSDALSVRGERHPNSKLSDSQRQAIVDSDLSLGPLADMYGVSKSAISWIKRHWHPEGRRDWSVTLWLPVSKGEEIQAAASKAGLSVAQWIETRL